MKLLLADLDGTLRRPASGSKFITEPHDQEIIPESSQAVKMWLKAHSEGNSGATKIIGISNQGGVASRYKSLSDCILEQQITIKLLAEEGIAIDSIYICTDFYGDECFRVFVNSAESVGHADGSIYVKSQLKFSSLILKGRFRKPNAGMLEAARLTHNSHPEECLYIGDREEDEQSAVNANIPYLHISEFQNIYSVI